VLAETDMIYTIYVFSIITQVIIEIRALPLAENGVIFCYNRLRGGVYFWEDKVIECHIFLLSSTTSDLDK